MSLIDQEYLSVTVTSVLGSTTRALTAVRDSVAAVPALNAVLQLVNRLSGDRGSLVGSGAGGLRGHRQRVGSSGFGHVG